MFSGDQLGIKMWLRYLVTALFLLFFSPREWSISGPCMDDVCRNMRRMPSWIYFGGVFFLMIFRLLLSLVVDEKDHRFKQKKEVALLP